MTGSSCNQSPILHGISIHVFDLNVLELGIRICVLDNLLPVYPVWEEDIQCQILVHTPEVLLLSLQVYILLDGSKKDSLLTLSRCLL